MDLEASRQDLGHRLLRRTMSITEATGEDHLGRASKKPGRMVVAWREKWSVFCRFCVLICFNVFFGMCLAFLYTPRVEVGKFFGCQSCFFKCGWTHQVIVYKSCVCLGGASQRFPPSHLSSRLNLKNTRRQSVYLFNGPAGSIGF